MFGLAEFKRSKRGVFRSRSMFNFGCGPKLSSFVATGHLESGRFVSEFAVIWSVWNVYIVH